MTPRTLEGIVVFTLLAGGLTAQQVNQPSAVTPQDSRKDAAAGTLRGQVADESGAVIPGATVTLTNFAGVAKTLKTGPDGTFSVPGLPPGRYTVRAFATGRNGESVVWLAQSPRSTPRRRKLLSAHAHVKEPSRWW